MVDLAVDGGAVALVVVHSRSTGADARGLGFGEQAGDVTDVEGTAGEVEHHPLDPGLG